MSAPPQFLNELWIRQFLAIAGWTVLIYDYLLTFDFEINYIWCAPWTTVKTMFLLNRYGTLIVQSFIALEELGVLSHGSREVCVHFLWFQSFFVLLSSETTRTLFLIRAWALWRCSQRVAMSLVSIYVVYVLALYGYASHILFKFSTHFEFPYLDETEVCVVYTDLAGAWLLGLISFLLDTGMFVVITYYLYKLCKESRQLYHAPLLRLLVRDAILFYVMVVFHDILTAVSLSVFANEPRNFVQVAFSFPLLTIAGQRVVLNLRGFQAKSYTTRDISSLVDRRIAAMQRRSYWRSVNLWVNDLHQELEMSEASALWEPDSEA